MTRMCFSIQVIMTGEVSAILRDPDHGPGDDHDVGATQAQTRFPGPASGSLWLTRIPGHVCVVIH